MPRRSKGPRLYFRQNRRDSRTGKPLPDVWVIRDGAIERSTGCDYDSLPEAEGKLTAYLAEKWTPAAASSPSRSDPAQVLVADVLALYASEKAPTVADPASCAGRIEQLAGWWGGKTVADVKRSACMAYATHRQTMPNASFKNPETAPRVSSETARRELEDLSSAIGWWHGEDTLTTRPEVWLPAKPESNRDALTRDQAAGLLKAAMGRRKLPDGSWVFPTWDRVRHGRTETVRGSEAANRRHLRRFVLMGLYTGTRHTVMIELLWEESATKPWVDLDAGLIFRRGKRVREQRNKKTPIITIPPRLLAHMRRWREADRREEARRRLADPDFRLVSVIHHGGRPLAGRIRTGFEGIVRDAGLDPEVTPHWMRHTAATWMMEANLDLWKAAGYLGMNPDTLLDHYGHHRPDYQAEAARAAGGRK